MSVIDPQNKELSWKKEIDAPHEPETRIIDFFSFTPEASGMNHIKISNAEFQKEVKIVSGMITPTEQPYYLTTLLTSIIILLTGAFLNRGPELAQEVFHYGEHLIYLYLCL